MANTRGITTRKWRRWRRKRIPESRIQKPVQWLPVGTTCEPVSLNSFAVEDSCPSPASYAFLELVPSGTASALGDIITVHGWNIQTDVVIDLPSDLSACNTAAGNAWQLATQSSHIRWYLARFNGAEYNNLFAGSAYDPFQQASIGSGGVSTPITQRDPTPLDWGESVRIPTPEIDLLAAWDPTSLTPCVDMGQYLKPDGTVDLTANYFRAKYKTSLHHTINSKMLLRKGMRLAQDDALILVVGAKSWYSSALLSTKMSAWGRIKISLS